MKPIFLVDMLLDQDILNLIEGLYDTMSLRHERYVAFAQMLCALFMFLFFAMESYKMMVGDKKLEVMPLLRPFALSLVVMFWGSFVDIIKTPAEFLTQAERSAFYKSMQRLEQESRQRYALIDEIGQKLVETSADTERAAQQVNNTETGDFFGLGESLDTLWNNIKGYYLIVVSKMRYVGHQLIEYVAVTFFQVCTYVVFFLQAIFGAILIILGPIAFSFSILPGFRDAYLNWIARFISVSLYSVIAYLVLNMAIEVVRLGIMQELAALNQVKDNPDAFVMYVATSSGSMGSFIAAILVAAIGMLTIPSISTWIVSTSGATNAMRTAGGVMQQSVSALGAGAKAMTV
jgi:hypothetical protein